MRISPGFLSDIIQILVKFYKSEFLEKLFRKFIRFGTGILPLWKKVMYEFFKERDQGFF